MTWDSAPPAPTPPPDAPSGHVPVMLAEVLAHLAPGPGDVIVDGTFGGGGYARAFLGAGARVVGIDRDPAAIARGRALSEEAPGLTMVEGRFGDMAQLVAGPVDAVVLDVGVSSYQLDQAERGFSFRFDGPLDMRMGPGGLSAADIANRAELSDLAHLLRTYGEERRAGAVARAIIEARPLTTTAQLARVCESAVRAGKDGIHPATRTFQALRIAVNDELGELARALYAAEQLLCAGGRLVVVAFHSLEDRIVKRFLAARTRIDQGSRHAPTVTLAEPSFAALSKGAEAAGAVEAARNPRARSAKLRAARRTTAPIIAGDPATLAPQVRMKGLAL